eukprot:5054152-Pleurochrysis_carterae.AAC.1
MAIAWVRAPPDGRKAESVKMSATPNVATSRLASACSSASSFPEFCVGPPMSACDAIQETVRGNKSKAGARRAMHTRSRRVAAQQDRRFMVQCLK